MSRRSGRFGKYGDLKRKEKLRQSRLMKADQTGNLFAADRSGMRRNRKARGGK
jgi:hypothetical protein